MSGSGTLLLRSEGRKGRPLLWFCIFFSLAVHLFLNFVIIFLFNNFCLKFSNEIFPVSFQFIPNFKTVLRFALYCFEK